MRRSGTASTATNSRKVGELKALLLAEASEDDGVSSALGPVGEANKALTAGDEPGFMGRDQEARLEGGGLVQSLDLACRPYEA
jgi:hypothetical protein